MNSTMYKDTSIFQGVCDFSDQHGNEWRIEKKHVYMLIDNSYVHQGYVKKGENFYEVTERLINS